MNYYTLCFALILWVSTTLSGQSKAYTLADTTFANTLLKESIDLNAKGKYEAAYAKADSAQLVFEQVLGKETKHVADALHQKGRSKSNSGKYDEGTSIYEQSLLIRTKLFGEEHIDLAWSYNNLAINYKNKGNFSKSIENHEKALKIRIKSLGNDHSDVAASYTNLGNVYWRTSNYDKAIEYGESALRILIKLKGEDNLDIATSYNNLGNVNWSKGNYDKAIEYNEKALKIRLNKLDTTNNEHKVGIAASYSNLGYCYTVNGDYDKAIEYTNKALEIRLKTLGLYHLEVGKSYSNLGYICLNTGHYDKAIEYYTTSLDINTKVLGLKHLDIASCYNDLGMVYYRKNNYNKAIQYYEKAIATWINSLGGNHPNIATYYTNYGLAYAEKGDYEKAITYYEKDLLIRLNNKSLSENHPAIAGAYDNIGNAYVHQKQYEQAIHYLEKALTMRVNIFGNNNEEVAMSYNNLGSAYYEKKDKEKALECFEKALPIFIKKLKKDHPHITNVYNNLGQVHDAKYEYDKAAELYIKALDVYSYTNKNVKDIKDINNLEGIINALYLLTQNQIHKYQTTHQKKHLSQAVDYAEQAIAALNYQNKALTTEGDKTQAKNQNYAVYEGAIQSSLLLADTDKNDNLRQATFNYAEQSKAGILQAQIKEADALRFAGIPDSLLQREYDLRVDITWRDKQRQEKINAGRSETDSTVLDISSKLFDLRQQYDTLKRQFERDYPQYYRLKYDLNTVNVGDVQQKLLAADQTLLSYFVGDSSVFMFVVNKNKYAVQEIKKDSLDSLVKQLRFAMYDNQGVTGDAYSQNAKNYTEIAYKLYEKLILPIKSQLQTNLIIVPDGILGYIPFEALLTEKPETHFEQYQLHPYLLKDYNISYNYSATLWQEMKSRKIAQNTEGGLISFAPTFGSDTAKIPLNTITDLLATRSDPLKRLYHNIEEVQAIQKIIGGKVYTGNFATKETFLKEAAKYRIIHLATHGKADDRIGDYAFLAFQETQDSADNGRLYVKDLYNCTLNADLVVLSACETGIGKWQRGEGIISLARAFAYAGTKSIVTTLWSIDDAGTKTLMASFYKNLKRGQTKDAALRQAKLDYLGKNASENAAPFHWAAFIAIGDMQALKK